MIKAILFDLDNTLIDRQKGLSNYLYDKFKQLSKDKDIINQMVNDVLLWDDNGNNPRLDTFTKLVNKYHEIVTFTPEEIDKEWRNLSGINTVVYEDSKETLKYLKTKYKIGILTNGKPTTQLRKLEALNVDDILDFRLISGDYICDKPDIRIFKYAVKQLRVKPKECIYVGDNYNIDVIGSRNAGLKPIYISRFSKEYNDVTTIYEIKELKDIL